MTTYKNLNELNLSPGDVVSNINRDGFYDIGFRKDFKNHAAYKWASEEDLYAFHRDSSSHQPVIRSTFNDWSVVYRASEEYSKTWGLMSEEEKKQLSQNKGEAVMNLQEAIATGVKKVVCTENEYLIGTWTKGKVYPVIDGIVTDDRGYKWGVVNAGAWPEIPSFEPYSFMGLENKEFTPDEIEQLASAVAEKVIDYLEG